MPLRDLMRGLLEPAGEGGTVLSSPLASLIGLGLSVADTRFAPVFKATVLEPEKLRLEQAQKNIKLQLELEKLRQLKELKLTGPAATAPITKPKAGVPSKPKESPPIVSPFLTAPQTIGGFQVPSAVPQAPPQQGVQPLPSPTRAVAPTGSVQEMKNAFSQRLFNVGASVGEISLIKAGATGYFSSLAKIKDERDEAGRLKAISEASAFANKATRTGVRPSLARHSLAEALFLVPNMTPEEAEKSISTFNKTFATAIKNEEIAGKLATQATEIPRNIALATENLRQLGLAAPSPGQQTLQPPGQVITPPTPGLSPTGEVPIRRRASASRGNIIISDDPRDLTLARERIKETEKERDRLADARESGLPMDSFAVQQNIKSGVAIPPVSRALQGDFNSYKLISKNLMRGVSIFKSDFAAAGIGGTISSIRRNRFIAPLFPLRGRKLKEIVSWETIVGRVAAESRKEIFGANLTGPEAQDAKAFIPTPQAVRELDPRAAARMLFENARFAIDKENLMRDGIKQNHGRPNFEPRPDIFTTLAEDRGFTISNLTNMVGVGFLQSNELADILKIRARLLRR
ncbi:hypothetical protein LCGC14_0516770 [marine sediment metagenome]|uniref:Uncharacterized protein n=1 Tax=marine sediment metagenome TaxID=412755 RepID=A0A0F9V7S7_9ZZZZ